MSTKTADWWKFTTTALCTVVVTLMLQWFGGQFEKINASQCKEIIVERVDPVRKDVDKLADSVATLTKLNQELRTDLKVLVAEMRAKDGRAEITQ